MEHHPVCDGKFPTLCDACLAEEEELKAIRHLGMSMFANRAEYDSAERAMHEAISNDSE